MSNCGRLTSGLTGTGIRLCRKQRYLEPILCSPHHWAEAISHNLTCSLHNALDANIAKPSNATKLHKATRRRERVMQRFKSPHHAQRFCASHDQINTLFRPHRHRLSKASYRHARHEAFDLWETFSEELIVARPVESRHLRGRRSTRRRCRVRLSMTTYLKKQAPRRLAINGSSYGPSVRQPRKGERRFRDSNGQPQGAGANRHL